MNVKTRRGPISWQWIALGLVILGAFVLPPGRAGWSTPIPSEGGLVVETFAVDYMDVEAAAEQVRLLLSPRGIVVTDARMRRIVVRDMPENIGKVRAYLQTSDKALPMVALQLAFTSRRDTSGGGAGVNSVVVTNNKVRASGGAAAGSTTTTLDSTMNMMVMSGSEGVLHVADYVPTPVLQFFNAYALERNLVAAGVVFQKVGTGFGVVPRVVGTDQVIIRVYPWISYVAPQGNGVIRAVEAASEVQCKAGQTMLISVMQRDDRGVVRQILSTGGFRDTESAQIMVCPRIVK